jgi:hypothetical protein
MRRVVPFAVLALAAFPAAAQMTDVSGVGSANRNGAGFGSTESITTEPGESALELLTRFLFGEKEEDPAAASDPDDLPCREYVRQVWLGNELVDASGVFCQEADGSWTLKK